VAASRTIFVAGAGIGDYGPLALAGRGFRVVILEKPNASRRPAPACSSRPISRVLIELGLQPRLATCRSPRRHQPDECGEPAVKSAACRSAMPHASRGAPYWVVIAPICKPHCSPRQRHPDIELRLAASSKTAVTHANGNDRGSAQRHERQQSWRWR